MAIYHLSMKPISRASGRSAVASAAYRVAECLTNERDGLIHDFTRRSGVEASEIVLPGDTVAKDGKLVINFELSWARDRSVLWNAAEASENRKDARVAREIEIALPHELSAEQRLALTRDFAQELARWYGVAVDFAIHAPHRDSNILNYHAHVMMTTRKVLERGAVGSTELATPYGLGEKSIFELENRKLEALGLPSTHEQTRDLRIVWEERANLHLARAGLEVRIDHRSYIDRGLEIEPTQHVGVHATQMQRRGKLVSRVRLDAEAAKRNAERIREHPEQVLELITDEKSVFDRHDIARVLHRAVDLSGAGEGAEGIGRRDGAGGRTGQEGSDNFQNILAQVMVSPALVELRAEHRDELGRVIQQARYSTVEMVEIERGMVRSADRMAEGRSFGVRALRVAAALSRQDEAIQLAGGAGLSDEQRAAVAYVTGAERIAAVVGLAGAGKSTMLAAAREAWEAEGFTVRGAALAGKAAEGLEESSGIVSRTLASWEKSWERGGSLGEGPETLGPRDVFVIDEAGMIGSRQLSRFIQMADAAGAKIVLVGDPEQLQPIGPGAAFRAVAERVGFVELEEIRRQRADWQREASIAFGRHRAAEGFAAYEAHGCIRFGATSEAVRADIVRDVVADMDVRPDGTRLVLAHRNADVHALNEAIRSVRKERGELTGGLVYQTAEGERVFAPGDRVLFRENDRDLGVKNGMLGTVALVAGSDEIDSQRLVVRLDHAQGPGQGRSVSISMADYAAIDHGYATTIHKAQGATVDRAYVLASGTMDRHLSYVAMTRHREGVQLYADRSELSDVQALTERLSRSQAKETTLDYGRLGYDQHDQAAYAARRGFAARVESEIVVPPVLAKDRVSDHRDVLPKGVKIQDQRQGHDAKGIEPGVIPSSPPSIEAGRVEFRARYEAYKQQKAMDAARDEKAREFVREWDVLTKDYLAALPGLEADPALGGIRVRLLQFGENLQAHPDVLRALHECGSVYGVGEKSSLVRVVADQQQPTRVIARLLDGLEADMRHDLKLAAEKAVELERKRQLDRSLSRSGPSMGR